MCRDLRVYNDLDAARIKALKRLFFGTSHIPFMSFVYVGQRVFRKDRKPENYSFLKVYVNLDH